MFGPWIVGIVNDLAGLETGLAFNCLFCGAVFLLAGRCRTASNGDGGFLKIPRPHLTLVFLLFRRYNKCITRKRGRSLIYLINKAQQDICLNLKNTERKPRNGWSVRRSWNGWNTGVPMLLITPNPIRHILITGSAADLTYPISWKATAISTFFLFGIILCGILLAALTSLAVPTKEELQKKAEAEKAAAEAQFTPSKATWTAAGDVVFHGPIMESATYYNSEDNTYNYDPIFDYCRDLIEASDMATVTLETSLAGEEAGYSSYPIFRSPDALADSLAGCGFDMINLASNHVYDGGG